MFSKLQYISQGTTAASQLANIQTALDAGCSWIQFRWKNATQQQILDLAPVVKERCAAVGATFIINDHAGIAKAVDADGLHLGLSDMRVAEARKILGPDKIIGGTANTLDDVLQRIAEGCAYIGLGPFRFTVTKEKLSPVLGVAGYQKIMDVLETKDNLVPLYAIGGILQEDLETLMHTGIYGVALSGLITRSPAKQLLVQQLNEKLYATTTYSR